MAGFIRQAGQFEGLLAVRRDQGEAGQVQAMHGLGIEAEPDAMRAAESLEFIQQRLGDHALAVIADDDGPGSRDHGLQQGRHARGQLSVQPVAGFTVNADHLLLVGDDARFDARRPGCAFQQAVAANAVLLQQPGELPAERVAADDAEEFRRRFAGR